MVAGESILGISPMRLIDVDAEVDAK